MSTRIVRADAGIDVTYPSGSTEDHDGTLAREATERAALAAEYADGFRRLASLVEANPELLDIHGFRYAFTEMLMPCRNRPGVAAVTRAAARAGAVVTKHFEGNWAGADLSFGPVSLRPYAGRDEMCERVVTGTRPVTKMVPDPDLAAAVPLVEVTETEEVVEWRCMPLLSDEDGAA